MSYKTGIPSLNLRDLKATGENSHDLTRFVDGVGRAYEIYGFCRVRGHKLQEETKRKLYTVARDFFNIPAKAKLRYKLPGVNRGYKGLKEESAKNSKEGDLKEFFHVGRELQPEELRALQYPDNVWPPEIPEFKDATIKAYIEFEASGNDILEAIALYLDLGREYFRERTRNGNSVLRLISYPPITSDPGNAIRSGAHEDINLITLLTGADSPGLEIQTRKEGWIPVDAEEGELVVNAGDMLQWLTNGRIRSTTHRVVNPPVSGWKQQRISMPFFMHPLDSVDLTPPEKFITTDRPQRFGNITAGRYLQERLGQNYKPTGV